MSSLASLAHPDRTVRVSDRRIVGLIAAFVAVGFFTSYRSLLPLLGSESSQAVLLVVPVAAVGLLLVALPRVQRVPEEVLVNFLFALPMLIALFSLLVVLPAKLSFIYWAYRLDLLAVPAFVAFALILFYGLPGVWAARPALSLLLLGWPPLLDTFTRIVAPPLADLDAALVGLVLKLAAPDVTRHADVFSLGRGGGWTTVEVSSTCAGLLAVISMLVLGSVVAAASYGPFRGKVRWFACAVALVLTLNVVRIAAVLVVANNAGIGAAFRLFHLVSGALLFAVAFTTMLLLLRRFGLELELTRMRAGSDETQPARRLALVCSIVIGVCAVAAFSTLRMDFRGAGMLDRAALIRHGFLVPPTQRPNLVAREPATGIGEFFGVGADAKLYYFKWPDGGYTSAQIIVDHSLSGLQQYGILQCFVTHGFRIYATQKQALPFGGTAEVIALRDAFRDLVAVTWVQPVRLAGGGSAWRRVTLYQYLDKMLGSAPRLDYPGPLGLWFVNRVLPYGGTHMPARFGPAAARARLLAAKIVEAG
jgi:exosortase